MNATAPFCYIDRDTNSANNNEEYIEDFSCHSD